ncbi:MAG: hypothetical protein ACK5RL_19295 [Acidimicrobiales bacterium]
MTDHSIPDAIPNVTPGSEPGRHLDPIELLARANPVPPSTTGAAATPEARRRFQEIIMTTPTPDRSTPDPIAEPVNVPEPGFAPPTIAALTASEQRRGRLRRWGVPATAAAAAAAVVAAGVAVILPGSTPAAAEAMVSAAQTTGSAESGSVVITANMASGGEAGNFEMVSHFDGDDLTMILEPGEGLDPADEFDQVELRLVDGVAYFMDDTGAWYSVDDPAVTSVVSGLAPIDVKDQVASGLIDIATNAENAEEVEPGHYTATTTMAELADLIPANPVLDGTSGLEANEVDRELPPELAGQQVNLDIRLDDTDQIDIVTFTGVDLTDEQGTPVSAEVVVDFQDLGVPQDIEAPASAQPVDLSDQAARD